MKKTLSLVLTMCIVLSLFATFVVSASAEEATNLAAGKSYTYPTEGLYVHWDAKWECSKNVATAITDGVKDAGYYGEGATSGWGSGSPNPLEVVIDLEAVYSLESFTYTLCGGVDGISEPESVSILVSEDGENFTAVEVTTTAGEEKYSSYDWTNCYDRESVAVAASAVNGRYVKFSFTKTGAFVFINELEVWGVEKKAEVALEWKPFFLSHFNNNTVEGSGVVLTEAYTGAGWWIHVALAPVAGLDGVYEVVAVSDGTPDGSGVAQAIPEGGFVYALNYGNDYPSLNMGDIDYTSPHCSNMIADVQTWKVGDKFVFEGLDLEGKTIPTSTPDANWYDDAYVCTAKYAAYVPGANQGTVVITKGDNIASGKTYELNGLHDTVRTYDDEGGQLTDGVFAVEAKYSDPAYVGLNSNSTYYKENNNVNVIVDLGESKDLYSVLISVSHENGNGIKAPSKITVSVSDDKTTWSDPVELAYTEELVTGLLAKATADVSASGRYVKYTLEPTEGGSWMFIDEIEVYEAKKTVTGGSTPEVIVETITVDGDLTDTGWAKDGWVTVTPDNGYWQSVPTTDTISYKYQLRADETKLYAAFVVDCAAVEGGNGAGTNVRFWINSDSEATVYTHFYDVYLKDGAVAVNAKYNTAKDANSGANIENSTIEAVMTTVDGKTYVEFSVDLAEFNGAEGFNYFVCVSNKVNENVCLYYPVVDAGVKDDGAEDRQANLPYKTWSTAKQATVDVEAIQLGEVVVNGGTNDNYGDAGIYAIAALAVVALIGTAVVIKKRA